MMGTKTIQATSERPQDTSSCGGEMTMQSIELDETAKEHPTTLSRDRSRAFKRSPAPSPPTCEERAAWYENERKSHEKARKLKKPLASIVIDETEHRADWLMKKK